MEDYISNNTPILHRCLKCEREWKISPSCFISMNVDCICMNSISKGERKLMEYFNKNNIKYIHQYSFKDLYDKNSSYLFKI